MSILTTYFKDFLSNIRLTPNQVGDCKRGHDILRERLHKDENIKGVIVGDFLQGSYRRGTSIRPFEEKNKSDVDIIVVTSLDRGKCTPRQAFDLFKPFLEKYYKGKYKPQGRSWGIELSYAKLDLVPTSAPNEAVMNLIKSESVQTDQTLEEARDWRFNPSWRPGGTQGATAILEKVADEQWRDEPLWIPDRELHVWDETHPLAQIAATQTKNENCNGHYVNVVRCLKWWRTTQCPTPKYPRSYPLEHLCCINCSNGIESVATGVVSVLESIRDQYRVYASSKKTPVVPDHGVPGHNVLGRVSGDDFAAFHQHITEAATLARRAFDTENIHDSAILWRNLFGDRFPEPPSNGGGGDKSPDNPGGYTPRGEVSKIGGGRFAI